MVSVSGRMSRVSQAVLPLLPAEACSVGPSAGLLEGPEGGVVFVFGWATYSYAAADEVGRRLAAVQLVGSKIATSAEVVITQGARLPQVGLLLALPALEATGLLEVAGQTYGPMRNGFYGLRVTLLMAVFMALLREPRAEGATRLHPVDLGRLLGADR